MKTYISYLLLILIGLVVPFTSVASNTGKVVRDGPIVVIKSGCFAFNLESLSQRLPQGETTLEGLALTLLSSLRELTPTEKALCDGTQPPVKGWFVASNGSRLSRPVSRYDVLTGLLVKHNTLRATIGEPCQDAIPGQSGKRQYRKLPASLNRPEGFVALCSEIK